MEDRITVIQKHIAGLKHAMNERINLIQRELEILKTYSPQTNRTVQQGRGDVLSKGSTIADESGKVKTEDTQKGCGRMYCAIIDEDTGQVCGRVDESYTAHCIKHSRSTHNLCGENGLCNECRESTKSVPKIKEIIRTLQEQDAKDYHDGIINGLSEDSVRVLINALEDTISVPEKSVQSLIGCGKQIGNWKCGDMVNMKRFLCEECKKQDKGKNNNPLSPVSNDSALTDESLFRHGEGEVQSRKS